MSTQYLPAQKITEEQLIECLKQGMSHRLIAEKYDMNLRSVEKRIQSLRKRGLSLDHDMTKVCPEGYLVKGVSSYYNSEGKLTNQWVKTKIDESQRLEVLKESFALFIEELPISTKSFQVDHHLEEDIIVIFPIGDAHIGMLAWEEECGENWDLKKAESNFIQMFQRVIDAAPASEEAIIVNLGDMLHYDNMEGVTSRSKNPLDIDGRYAKMVRVCLTIVRFFVEKCLEKYKKVTLINEIGNHDETGAIFLSAAFSHIYQNEPRLNVIDKQAPVHYYRFGKNLFCITHGDKIKMEQLPSVAACDKSKDWGETEFRYGLTGHIHSQNVKEFPGMVVESFRTIAPKDSYASWYGYRAGRDTKAIVYHKNYGEIARHIINIAMIKE